MCIMLLFHITPVNQVWWLDRDVFLRLIDFSFPIFCLSLYTRKLVFKDWCQITSSFRVNTVSLREFQFGLLWRIAESGNLPGPVYLWEKSKNYWRSRGQLCCCKEQYECTFLAGTGQVGKRWATKSGLYSAIVISSVKNQTWKSFMQLGSGYLAQIRMGSVLLAPNSCLCFVCPFPFLVHLSVYPSMPLHTQALPASYYSLVITGISIWVQFCLSLAVNFCLQ